MKKKKKCPKTKIVCYLFNFLQKRLADKKNRVILCLEVIYECKIHPTVKAYCSRILRKNNNVFYKDCNFYGEFIRYFLHFLVPHSF